MCSHFLKRMENYQGDLADILRASGSGSGSAASESPASAAGAEWEFSDNPVNFSDPFEAFGDPFSLLRDPLLHDIDTPVSGFFQSSSTVIKAPGEDGGNSDNGGINIAHKVLDHEEVLRPPNIFSRMLQISPNAKLSVPPCDSTTVMTAAVHSPNGLNPCKLVQSDHILISPSGSKGSVVQSPGLQISSPRNPGIKRRKTQAKKVVCIPAPAPANSRSSGEVVPSDLWAWRKYGQKPIKGSPYPRGYYRCSSSKGCSARKQVERSRTDPNMLVITYTSEHNHPWPTQRNSLAGSTRSHQTTKNSTNGAKNPPNSQTQNSTTPKEDQKDTSTENSSIDANCATMKQEMDLDTDHNRYQINDTEFDKGFPASYKPALPDSSNHSEDSFFAGLGEIDADPLDLLFTQGFSVGDDRDTKTLDPFSFYDWPRNNGSTTTSTTSAAATSYGGAKRDS